MNTSYNINVNPSTATPTGITLTTGGAPLTTGARPGSLIGRLSTTDPNAASFSYRILGGTHSHLFGVVGDQLVTTGPLLLPGTYTLVVQSEDVLGFSFTQLLQFAVQPSATPPTGISLKGDSVEAFRPAGTTIGTLSTTDPNLGATHSYKVIGPSAELFAVDARGNVTTSVVFQNSVPTTIPLTIRTTNSFGLSLDTTLSVRVLPASDDLFASAEAVFAFDPNSGRSVAAFLDAKVEQSLPGRDALTFRNPTRLAFHLKRRATPVRRDLPATRALSRSDAFSDYLLPGLIDQHPDENYVLALATGLQTGSGGFHLEADTLAIANVFEVSTQTTFDSMRAAADMPGGAADSAIEALFTYSDAPAADTGASALSVQRTTIDPRLNVLRANTIINVRGTSRARVDVRTTVTQGLTPEHVFTLTFSPAALPLVDESLAVVPALVETEAVGTEGVEHLSAPVAGGLTHAPLVEPPPYVPMIEVLDTFAPPIPQAASAVPAPPPEAAVPASAPERGEPAAPTPVAASENLPWYQPEIYTVSVSAFMDDPSFLTHSASATPPPSPPRPEELPSDRLFSRLSQQQQESAIDDVDLSLWIIEPPQDQAERLRAALDAQVFASADEPGSGAWGLSVFGTEAALRPSSAEARTGAEGTESVRDVIKEPRTQ